MKYLKFKIILVKLLYATQDNRIFLRDHLTYVYFLSYIYHTQQWTMVKYFYEKFCWYYKGLDKSYPLPRAIVFT